MNKLFLIIDPSDIFYCTGYRPHEIGHEFLICEWFVTEKGNVTLDVSSPKELILHIFCNALSRGNFNKKIASEWIKNWNIYDTEDLWKEACNRLGNCIAESSKVTIALQDKLNSYGLTLEMGENPLQNLRKIKLPHEIEHLKISQLLNKKVYDMIVPYLIPWVTEEEIARKILISQLEVGFSGPSFPSVVAFGENTSCPHHSPTQTQLQPHDLIMIDMGGIYQWYCSDLTRCLIEWDLGKSESKTVDFWGDEQVDIQWQPLENEVLNRIKLFQERYSFLEHITREIISQGKPGMKTYDLDKKAREMLGEFAPYFKYSLWHGVWLNIHERPHISPRSDEIFQPGMVVAIEIGYSIESKNDLSPYIYGLRFEEMCVVTEEGMESV